MTKYLFENDMVLDIESRELHSKTSAKHLFPALMRENKMKNKNSKASSHYYLFGTSCVTQPICTDTVFNHYCFVV